MYEVQNYFSDKNKILEIIEKEDAERKDSLSIKVKLTSLLGDSAKEYWSKFRSFIEGGCTKSDFDNTVRRILRKGGLIKLHNDLVFTVIHNASKKLYIPMGSSDDKLEDSDFEDSSQPKTKTFPRLNSETWRKIYMHRTIRSFSGEDRLRLRKLSQAYPYSRYESIISREISRRECVQKFNDDTKSGLGQTCNYSNNFVVSGIQDPSLLPAIFSGDWTGFLGDEIRKVVKFYSTVMGLEISPDDDKCIDMMKYVIECLMKNYISRTTYNNIQGNSTAATFLSDIKKLKASKPKPFKIAVIPDPSHSSSEGGLLDNVGIDNTEASGHSILLNRLNERQDNLHFHPISKSNMGERPSNEKLAGLNGSIPFEMVSELNNPKWKDKLQDKSVNVPENTFDMEASFTQLGKIGGSGFPWTRDIQTLDHRSEDSILSPKFIRDNLTNSRTLFTPDSMSQIQTPFFSGSVHDRQGSAYTLFNFKNSGINCLSSNRTFWKLLLHSETILESEYVGNQFSRGLEDSTKKLEFSDIYLRVLLDFNFLSNTHGTMRILEDVLCKTDNIQSSLDEILETKDFIGD